VRARCGDAQIVDLAGRRPPVSAGVVCAHSARG
jgi:hypothetical protein